MPFARPKLFHFSINCVVGIPQAPSRGNTNPSVNSEMGP